MNNFERVGLAIGGGSALSTLFIESAELDAVMWAIAAMGNLGAYFAKDRR